MPGQWLQKIETFIIVTVISVLVWLYADSQNVLPYSQHIRIELVAPSNQDLAIEPALFTDVTLDFRASKSQQQEFQSRYKDNPLQIEVPPPEAGLPAEQSLNLLDLVRNSALKDLGLNITGATPPALPVRIEPLVTLTLPVVVPKGDDLELANVQIPDLEQAEVTVPASMAELVRNSSVIAPLTANQMIGVKEDIPDTRTVQLTLPEAVMDQADAFQKANVRISPKTANVTFTLQSKNESFTIRRIRIDFRVSPGVLRQFDIDIPTANLFLADVEVNGPSKEIKKIESGDTKVGAYILLTSENLQNNSNDLSFTPQLDLPPGVICTTSLKPVTITATPKSQQLTQ